MIIGGGQSNGVRFVADNVSAVIMKLFETVKYTAGVDIVKIRGSVNI